MCVLTVTKVVTISLRPKLRTTALRLATTPPLSSTLGRTRTCDLLIRSQTRSRTGGDREGHGKTPGSGQIAVKVSKHFREVRAKATVPLLGLHTDMEAIPEALYTIEEQQREGERRPSV